MEFLTFLRRGKNQKTADELLEAIMTERSILESWKEISGYLKRSEKTCQRWEIELGLPIHRLDGTPSARVFAYPDELEHWIKEKLHSREAEAPQPVFVLRLKKKKIAMAAGALFGLAASAGLIWHFFIQQPVAFPLGDLPTVAFLPFENVTGDEALEPWRSALPQLFYTEFLQSRTVGVPMDREPWETLKKLGLQNVPEFTPEELRKIAEELEIAGHVATGSLVKSNQDIIVSLSLHDSKTGEIIQSFRTICRGEKGLFAGVDELTRKIKSALNIPRRLISHDVDDDVSQIVTGSPEALKFYCLGMQKLREDKTDEALAQFEKATQVDAEFGEAYFQLFEAHRILYERQGDRKVKEETARYGEKAFASIDRINAWSRGTLINDYYLEFQTNLPMAAAEYRKLMAIRPDDPILMLQLAQVYSAMEDKKRVIALLDDDCAKQDSRNLVLLADSYLGTGRPEEAEKILDEYLGKNPQAPLLILRSREKCALSQGKFDEALAFNERAAMGRKPNFISSGKAPIFITSDDFASAEKELRRFLDQRNWVEVFSAYGHLSGLSLTQGKIQEALSLAVLAAEKAEGIYDWSFRKRSHFLLANLHRLSGNLPEALAESEKACPCYEADDFFTNPETGAPIFTRYDDISCLPYFHQRALIALEMGRVGEFEKQLAEIKQLVEHSSFPNLMRVYYHLLGQRELRENKFDGAVGYFWKALNLLPYSRALKLWPSRSGQEYDIDSAQYFYSLGEAYYEAGRFRSALDLYKKVPPYWEQRVISGDIYARSFYRIAKIYDQGGKPGGAPEEQNKTEKALAVENYRKFLSLWKDADSVFTAEVEDARARLASLEAE